MVGDSLEELKKEYEKLSKKHNLPSFKELNEDFYIEKISENETDLVIREIRRYIGEKLSNYLRVIEAFLNPQNVPMFVYSTVKSIGANEKSILTEAYKKLSKSEIKLMELDLDFSEEKEAEFIKESHEMWQEIKKDLLKILDTIKGNWDKEAGSAVKSYFG